MASSAGDTGTTGEKEFSDPVQNHLLPAGLVVGCGIAKNLFCFSCDAMQGCAVGAVCLAPTVIL